MHQPGLPVDQKKNDNNNLKKVNIRKTTPIKLVSQVKILKNLTYVLTNADGTCQIN